MSSNNEENQTDKKDNLNEIGFQIEKIMKENFHEDTYFTKSVEKFDGMTFYGFNYTNRKQKCFTGFSHDSIGFYCWMDSQSNIMLKCLYLGKRYVTSCLLLAANRVNLIQV